VVQVGDGRGREQVSTEILPWRERYADPTQQQREKNQ